MNTLSIFTLKALRKLYTKAFNIKQLPKPECEQDPDKASQIIYDALMDEKPCMIARFGSTELVTMTNYISIKQQNRNIFDYISGKSLLWWWETKMINQMQQWSGFFPAKENKIEEFCELMLTDIPYVDVLGSWLPEEKYVQDKLKNAQMISLILLEPYISKSPWSRSLKGKRVLVVHPFAEQIEEQYKKREVLFSNQDVLPNFQLQTIAAVQSLGGENNGFDDWFDALNWMKKEIDKREYDICLIGCGAYGFPLAAHVKRSGKKAVHLGGALQLLFGIKGNRWEANDYAEKWGLPNDFYTTLLNNENWKKPSDNLKPINANKVEDACYW